jgi:hypothetical protein
MFHPKRVCGLAVIVVAVAALGGSAAGAHASVAPRVRAMRAARVLFARSLPARLRAHVDSTAGVPVSPGTDLLLFTDPIHLQVHGLAYRMSMYADATVDQFGSAPELSVGFDRSSRGVSGRINGLQEHVYGFSSTDMVMTADQGLTGLHIDTRRSFRPTRVNMNFVPDQVRSASCRLFFGGQGTESVAEGTLDTKVFRIHTGTRPYFGTVTTPPQTAQAFSDPGCSAGGVGGGVTLGRTVRRYHEPCQGRESITTGSPFGGTSWEAEVGYRGARAFVGAQTASSTTTNLVEHLAVALQSAAGVPRPHRSAHGAVAKIGTDGNPMFSGGATFVSHRRPSVSKVRVCSVGRQLRRFVATRYRGTLSPDDDAPLTALFDTGGYGLERGAALLVIRSYLR